MLRYDSNDSEEIEPNNQKGQNPPRAATGDKKWKKEVTALMERWAKKTKWRGWKTSWRTGNFFPDR